MVTGKITRNNGDTIKTTSFDLVVAAPTCATSSESATLASAGISDQFYVVGSSTNATLTVTPFSVEGGTYCTQANIVYTFDSTGMSFISFNSLTMTFNWAAQATLSHIGEYTLTLEGKISRTSPRPDI